MSSGSSDSVSSGSRWLSRIGVRSRARPGAIQWLILCGAALVIAIALGTGYLALQFRERALEVSERELNNSALLLSRHFDQQLADLQHVHDDVVAHMQAGRVDSAEGFERQMSTLAAHEMLRTKLAALPHVGGLNVFNVKGQLINTSEMWPVADASITDRRYYREFTSGEPTPDVIVEPAVSKVTKGLDDDLRAQDHRSPRRDCRLCDPGCRTLAFPEFRRFPGAERRHHDLDDSPRRHRHRPLSARRQSDRHERRTIRRRFRRRWRRTAMLPGASSTPLTARRGSARSGP